MYIILLNKGAIKAGKNSCKGRQEEKEHGQVRRGAKVGSQGKEQRHARIGAKA
jgi:hypothetical protein